MTAGRGLRRKIEFLRCSYRRLPLPMPVRTRISIIKYRIVKGVRRSWKGMTGPTDAKFYAPDARPAPPMDEKEDFIIWGVINWHFRLQRPQHIARALVEKGRRVFYISVHMIDEDRAGFEVEPLDSSNRLFEIRLFAKGAPVVYHTTPDEGTVKQLRHSIGEVMLWADIRRPVSLVQHPFWCDIASVIPDALLVYDCMDLHEGFGNTADSVLKLEHELFRQADLTVVTSAWLDEIVSIHTSKRALIRNACDYDYFSIKPATVYQDPQGRPVIGYFGAIADWFDLELVAAVARRFSQCAVLLIGADTVGAASYLRSLPNVIMLGEVSFKELPFYLYGFDVCLLPFKIVPLTQATNPVKVYEYLSAGKPVVAVNLPEMKQFAGLIKVANSSEDFLSKVEEALEQPGRAEDIQQRRDFARRQTWHHRVDNLLQKVKEGREGPPVSVVVVTFNNLDLTRQCLTSIDTYSGYPRLEIIVVDNNSTDGTREFLMQWQQEAPANRKIILNKRNRGFAAANNQGMALADGEYIVLLNNDTHVTPGWIRTLVNHLRRNPQIGIIGPVTNNIGNEAKIEISYTTMEEMLSSSRNYIYHHLGLTFELRTLAFFCVMIPRSVYEKVGPLDEIFGLGFFEDDDYCRRIEEIGLRIVCAEDVFVHHHLSASFDKVQLDRRQKLFERNKALYEKKWGIWKPHRYRKNISV